jgi:hypothetical protein
MTEQAAAPAKKARVQRTPKCREISRTYAKGYQDRKLTIVEAVELNGVTHKLKTVVCRDSYDRQSYCRTSRWDGTQWQVVHSIPTALLEVNKISQLTEYAGKPNEPVVNYMWDYSASKRVALEVVF